MPVLGMIVLSAGGRPRHQAQGAVMSQRRITKMSAYDPKRAARESKRANQRAIMHARALATATTQTDRNN